MNKDSPRVQGQQHMPQQYEKGQGQQESILQLIRFMAYLNLSYQMCPFRLSGQRSSYCEHMPKMKLVPVGLMRVTVTLWYPLLPTLIQYNIHMGNNSSEATHKPAEHVRLRQHTIITQSNVKYMVVQCPLYSQKQLQIWEKEMLEIPSSHSLFLPVKHQLQQDGICGTTGSLTMIFEFYPYVLKEEIVNRRKLNSPFSEQQIWYLLFEMVDAAKAFERRGMKSGDIRPANIVINEEGQIQVVNRCSFPEESVNYVKAFEQKIPCYLSPEELTELEKNVGKPKSDPVIAEAFSIGLTVLDIGLLFDSETLYDMTYLSFKNHVLNENLDKWKNSNYSQFLIKTVVNMLEISYLERPTPGEIHSILDPYSKQIRALQPFFPDKNQSKQKLEQYQALVKSKQTASNKKIFRPKQLPTTAVYSPVTYAQSGHNQRFTVNVNPPQPEFKDVRYSQPASIIPHSKVYLQEEEKRGFY